MLFLTIFRPFCLVLDLSHYKLLGCASDSNDLHTSSNLLKVMSLPWYMSYLAFLRSTLQLAHQGPAAKGNFEISSVLELSCKLL